MLFSLREKVTEKKITCCFPCAFQGNRENNMFVSLTSQGKKHKKRFPNNFPVTENNMFFSLLSLREKNYPPKGG
jgi:hypothetical protein